MEEKKNIEEVQETETQKSTEPASEEVIVTKKVSKLTIVAAVFGMLLLITALSLVIFSSLNSGLPASNVEEVSVSENESLLNNLFSLINREIDGIDVDTEMSDFEDVELAVEEGEEELESAIDDMDLLLEDLDSIDDDLGNFEDEDFSL